MLAYSSQALKAAAVSRISQAQRGTAQGPPERGKLRLARLSKETSGTLGEGHRARPPSQCTHRCRRLSVATPLRGRPMPTRTASTSLRPSFPLRPAATRFVTIGAVAPSPSSRQRRGKRRTCPACGADATDAAAQRTRRPNMAMGRQRQRQSDRHDVWAAAHCRPAINIPATPPEVPSGAVPGTTSRT